jgi:hypothetical protein
MTPTERFYQHRLHEELIWLRLHVRYDYTEAEAMAYLHDQCGFTNGTCRYATSDYCVLDCPFRPETLP